MICSKCGKDNADTANVCINCGAPLQAQGAVMGDAQDVAANKTMGILAYLIFFLPLIACPQSPFGKFHANQGLLVLILSVGGSIVLGILQAIVLAIFWVLGILFTLIWIVFPILILVLVIMGMVSASKGEMKPLPIIGKFTIIK